MGGLPVGKVIGVSLQGERGDCESSLLLLIGLLVHFKCLLFLVVHAHEASFDVVGLKLAEDRLVFCLRRDLS